MLERSLQCTCWLPYLYTAKRVGLLLLIVAFCLLASCSTGYHSMGFAGGFKDVQIDANTFRVEFHGNGFTSRSKVENSLLYRCAEVTVEQGFDFFVIMDGVTDRSINGAAIGSSVTTFNFYSGQHLIKLFHGQVPENAPNAYNARTTMSYMRSEIVK